MSLSVAKWTFFLSLCASRITSSLFQIPCWNCLELFSILCPRQLFCIRNFHRLWHRNKFVHQIVMCHRSKSFTCNVILMVFGLRRFCSLSRRFMSVHFSIIHGFGTPFHCQFSASHSLSRCLSVFDTASREQFSSCFFFFKNF